MIPTLAASLAVFGLLYVVPLLAYAVGPGPRHPVDVVRPPPPAREPRKSTGRRP